MTDKPEPAHIKSESIENPTPEQLRHIAEAVLVRKAMGSPVDEVVEIIRGGDPAARASQFVVEVITPAPGTEKAEEPEPDAPSADAPGATRTGEAPRSSTPGTAPRSKA